MIKPMVVDLEIDATLMMDFIIIVSFIRKRN